jgi:gas vesicle protein
MRYVGMGFAGALIGIAVGLLVAPGAGRDTRRRLSRTLTDESEAFLRHSRAALDGVRDYFEEQLVEERERTLRRAVNG